MKLEHLKLSNFRGFRSFEITFDPSFTVLLGRNMAGKSAVLDGAAVALGGLFNWILDPVASPIRDIEDDEVHQTVVEVAGVPDLQRQLPASVLSSATARELKNDRLIWQRTREGTKTSTSYPSDPFFADAARMQLQLALPVIAQYGTQRTWRGFSPPQDLRGIGSRYDGYEGCFNISSTHSRMAAWMRKQTLVQLQRGGGHIQPQLAAVEAAVKRCIDGITRFWFDVQYDELRLEWTNREIQSFSMLSEGYRNSLAMVADIAWRCSVLNPQHGLEAHLVTDGVVLIDELDLHLHPAWQRRIVSDLRRTFPKIQFIVTTHSPQIVASVSRSQIRLLDRNQLVADKAYVEGRDANQILEDVFGVSPRPEDVQLEIDVMYRLIEDEEFAAARVRLAALQQRLGPEDSEIVRARWILETEETEPEARDLPSA
jgi:predicted ATP-binding protein involved in virulence